MRIQAVSLPLFAIASAGCAATPPPSAPAPRPAVEIAVLAPAWATEPAPYEVGTESLIRGLAEGGGLRPRPLAAKAGCADETGCLERALSGSAAEEVLVVRLAALGDTVLVRAVMVHRRRGTQESARQEVVHDATPERVSKALGALGAALAAPYAPPPPPPPPPLVKTPWFWAAVAGGLALTGAAVGAAVYATERRPDVVITPP